MIFVDTSAWFSVFVPGAVDYVRATAWLASNRVPLVTTDYVIDETLTLLRARGQRALALNAASELFAAGPATVHFLTEIEIREALDVFTRFADKDWSFTDCASKVVMERLGITTAFAFDRHFQQFGSIAVVPD